jgi:hypothetical protein
VQSVPPAPGAKLLHLDTVGIVALVLLGGIIPPLALGASQRNYNPHLITSILFKSFRAKGISYHQPGALSIKVRCGWLLNWLVTGKFQAFTDEYIRQSTGTLSGFI